MLETTLLGIQQLAVLAVGAEFALDRVAPFLGEERAAGELAIGILVRHQ